MLIATGARFPLPDGPRVFPEDAAIRSIAQAGGNGTAYAADGMV